MTVQELKEILQYEIPDNVTYTVKTLSPALKKVILRLQDDKSDKFWQCETLGRLLMVNYGKWETNGRCDVKEFPSEEECMKQAEKQIASKKKKGYTETADFEEIGHCYFDAEEIGISRVTSNPVFRTYCSSDFYYDCGNEFAPFGNDTGNDVLALVQEACRKYPRYERGDFAYSFMHYTWALPCLPAQLSCTVSDEELLHDAGSDVDGMDGADVMRMCDQITIAAVLGKFKVKGMLERHEIFQLFRALDRRERLCKLLNPDPPAEFLEILQTIRIDLYCYDRDRYAGQYYSLIQDYDDYWNKKIELKVQKGRELFGIPETATGTALAEAVYQITENLLQGGIVPPDFRSEGELFDVLGSMLGNAICEAYHWTWIEAGEPVPNEKGFVEIILPLDCVVSPDRMYSLETSHLIRDILTENNIGPGGENDNTVMLLFNMLANVHEQLHNTTMKYLPLHTETYSLRDASWRQQFDDLWNELVPPSGAASTIQGEVIRIIGRIRYEVMNNGGVNWDENFQKMLAALPRYFRTFDDRAAERGCFLAPKITANCNERLLDDLTEIVVQWVTQHSDPVKLEQVGYDR